MTRTNDPRTIRATAVLTLAGVLAACGTSGASRDSQNVPTATATSGTTTAMTSTPTPGATAIDAPAYDGPTDFDFPGIQVIVDPPPDPDGCEVRYRVSNEAIPFAKDSAVIPPAGSRALEALATEIAKNNAAEITIKGHTSTEGDADYNQQLSEDRAKSVKEALQPLLSEHIDYNVAGRGERDPLVDPEQGLADRERNRRVEIRARSAVEDCVSSRGAEDPGSSLD